MKKLMSIILTLAMMLSMCVLTSAADSNSVSVNFGGEEVTVQAIDTNRLLVTEDGEKSLITFSEKNNIITTTVRNTTNGGEAFFIKDNDAGTLYSSITGYTGIVQTAADEPGTYKIPFSELALFVDDMGDAADIIAAICTITGHPTAAGVATIVAGILSLIKKGLNAQSSDSGIEYTLDYVTIHKQQGGHDFYVDVLKIVDIAIY